MKGRLLHIWQVMKLCITGVHSSCGRTKKEHWEHLLKNLKNTTSSMIWQWFSSSNLNMLGVPWWTGEQVWHVAFTCEWWECLENIYRKFHHLWQETELLHHQKWQIIMKVLCLNQKGHSLKPHPPTFSCHLAAFTTGRVLYIFHN